MLAMGFEPTSSLLKRQVRQPLRYASACKNHSASAPHGCRTRLITIKSRVHDRSANGAKFYDSAFVSVFVSSSLSSLLSLYNCSNRDRTDNLSGMDRILSPVELCCSSRDRSRTCDLLINSQALYQLGYPGILDSSGTKETRTPNFYLARVALSQLSYGPIHDALFFYWTCKTIIAVGVTKLLAALTVGI